MQDMPPMKNDATSVPQAPAPRRRKFWIGYVLSILGFVITGLSIAFFIAAIVSSVKDDVDREILMPGEGTFQLAAGEYEIEYKIFTDVDGTELMSPRLEYSPATLRYQPEFRCRLANAETQDDLLLTPCFGERHDFETHDGKQRSSITLYRVTVPESGEYTLYGSPLLTDDGDAGYILGMDRRGAPRGFVFMPLAILGGTVVGVFSFAGLVVTIVLHCVSRKKSEK
jgi:hypothetical protein